MCCSLSFGGLVLKRRGRLSRTFTQQPVEITSHTLSKERILAISNHCGKGYLGFFFGFPFKTRWMAWVLWYVLLYPTICIVHLRLSKRTLLGLIVPFFKSDTCSSHYKRRDHDHHPRDYFCVTFWMTQHGNVSFSFRWIMDGRLLLITSLLPQRGLQSFLHNMYHLGSK